MQREYPDRPVVGVGAVVLERGRVLLVRRAQEPLKGEWSLPGGGLELGETLAEGARREVLEETGLIVEVLHVVEVVDRIVREADSDRVQYHYVLVDFLCRPAGGVLGHGSDALEARWVEREHLTSLAVASFTVQVIEKAFEMVGEA